MHRIALPLFIASLTACATATPASQLPLWTTPPAAPQLTVVWVGRGETSRLVDGAWVRAPEFDYEFSVEQRRFADHWDSVKHLVRHHPGYDGSAGPREQTLRFHLELLAGDAVRLASSLGDGEGTTDQDFRSATLTFHPGLPAQAPFDTYRITQRYDYEGGQLVEQVYLDKGQAHWVRNDEQATLFAPTRFPTAPTRR